MSDILHYRYQADQAKRLARQVSDPQLRERLLETADEYSRYASLIESRVAEFSRSSFKVEHRLLNKDVLSVEGFETRVWTVLNPADPGRLRSAPIPAEVLALFGPRA